jgi:anti-sigma regulatory factor (Ser/Thr protein kinase)
MGQHGATDSRDRCFRHATLFYAGEREFMQGALPFLKDALANEEPALVAVSARKIELLRQALGDDAERVHFADMQVLGSNPARIIPAWRRFLGEHASDEGSARGIGEPIWAERSDAELTECQRHESLLNVAFDGGQAWQLLCPYDLEALEDHVIEAARLSHPFLEQDGTSTASDTYLVGHEAPSPFDGDLPAPSVTPSELAFDERELGSVRWLVSQGATDAALTSERANDLVLAVNELATNSLLHGGGAGTLRMWTEADTLLCEVRDHGHITEPLTGRIPPAHGQQSGRGLWVVNHLCDLVQIRSTSTGSVVRVHMRLA